MCTVLNVIKRSSLDNIAFFSIKIFKAWLQMSEYAENVTQRSEESLVHIFPITQPDEMFPQEIWQS